jgi:hypothetical protein
VQIVGFIFCISRNIARYRNKNENWNVCFVEWTYHHPVPIVLKSGSFKLLELSRPVQACNGITLPYVLSNNSGRWSHMLSGWSFERRKSRSLLEYYMYFVGNLEVLIQYSRQSQWDSNRFLLLSESRALELYQRKPAEIICTTINRSFNLCVNKLCYIPNVFCTEKVLAKVHYHFLG